MDLRVRFLHLGYDLESQEQVAQIILETELGELTIKADPEDVQQALLLLAEAREQAEEDMEQDMGEEEVSAHLKQKYQEELAQKFPTDPYSQTTLGPPSLQSFNSPQSGPPSSASLKTPTRSTHRSLIPGSEIGRDPGKIARDELEAIERDLAGIMGGAPKPSGPKTTTFTKPQGGKTKVP